MTSPIVDTTFGELTGAGFSIASPAIFNFSGTNKTAGANETVFCCIAYNLRFGGPGTISSLTVSGLTFVHQFTVTNTTSGQEDTTIEVWSAPASSAFNAGGSNLTYTIDWTTGPLVDNVVACVFALEGLFSFAAPSFDTDASSSAFNATNTGAPTVIFNTVQADDLLIALSANANPFGGNLFPTAPSGWTQIAAPSENNGLAGVVMGVNTKSVSAPQSSATFQDAATGTHPSWTALVMALTADSSGATTGTWASTETPDTLAASGIVGGNNSWASTEAPDTFAAEGADIPPGGGLLAPLDVEEAVYAHAQGVTAGVPVFITVNTDGTRRICVLMIEADANSLTVAPNVVVVSSPNVAWGRAYQTLDFVESDFDIMVKREVWIGYAPLQLASEIVTVRFDMTTDSAGINYLAIGGSSVSAAPFFDPLLPPTSQVRSDVDVVASTLNNDNVLVSWAVGPSRSGRPGVPAGFVSQLFYGDIGGPVTGFRVEIGTNIINEPMTAVHEQLLSNSAGELAYLIFAITGERGRTPPVGPRRIVIIN